MPVRCIIALAVCLCGCAAQSPAPLQAPIPFADRLRDSQLDQVTQNKLEALLRAHDYTTAETLLATDAGRREDAKPILLLLADILFLDGKQLNTVVVLKKAELLGPLDEKSRFLLALCYVALGNTSVAIKEFQILESANPLNSAYPYWLSRLAHRQRNYASALSYAERATKLNGSFVRGFDQLGLCYAALDRNEEAIRAYQRALSLNHEQSLNWPWPALNLGTVYFHLNRFAEAEAALQESLDMEPRFPAAHYRLGQVFERKGELDNAIREFEKAAAFDSTYPDPHYILARIYRQRKNFKLVAQELDIFKTLRDADIQKGITRPN